jgi:hypothetical protein
LAVEWTAGPSTGVVAASIVSPAAPRPAPTDDDDIDSVTEQISKITRHRLTRIALEKWLGGQMRQLRSPWFRNGDGSKCNKAVKTWNPRKQAL